MRKLARADDNALNARLPRHFAYVVTRHDARRGGKKGFSRETKRERNAMRLPLVSLESPFGVWGLLAMQKTPRPTSSSKERFPKF